MLFSIIIPAYKRRFLSKAVESVISQSFTDWEMVIVDDCSPEGLENILQPYLQDTRIRYVRNSLNYGAEKLADNWNNCLKLCNGQYVICMGDDDMLTPDSLREYSEYIAKYPGVGVVHGQTEIIDENENVIELMEPRFEHETALQLIYYRWAGLGRQQFVGDFCYNRETLLKNGGFYILPLAWGSDDITAVIAATAEGIANTQRVCFRYRKNLLSISSAGNTKRKAEALLMQREWYASYFKSYPAHTDEERNTLKLLEELLPKHFTFHTCDMMLMDLRNNRLNIFYWIKYRKRYALPQVKILISFLKSLMKP